MDRAWDTDSAQKSDQPVEDLDNAMGLCEAFDHEHLCQCAQGWAVPMWFPCGSPSCHHCGQAAADPILGLVARFKADPAEKKAG